MDERGPVPHVVVTNAEVDGAHTDVRLRDGRVAELGTDFRAGGADVVIDAAGGALIAGLHDHHLHVLALAAALSSVQVGPPHVTDLDGLRRALGAAGAGAEHSWVRAIGYHDSVAGPLDRDAIDNIVSDRPVRVQYRTGTMWMLNSCALSALGLDAIDHPGVERDGRGRPTGRLIGADELLRVGDSAPPPDLSRALDLLSSFGVTGVTDATPFTDRSALELLAHARRGPRITVTGGPSAPALAGCGPVKLVVGDHDLPSIEDLVRGMRAARHMERPVAVHCVTRVGLVLALAAWEEVGAINGDRIEHGAVIDIDHVATIAALGLTVVTQPNFIHERGDQYLREVDPEDLPHLYRCASLLDSGVRVGGSTDAPFGDPDPWPAIAAAIDRTTRAGALLGGQERIPPRRALDLFLGPLADPGGPARRIRPGARADLCLLDEPLEKVLTHPGARRVRATFVGGTLAHQA